MKIERVTSAGSAEFEALVRIYRESLPASECKGVGALQAMIARPEYRFLVAKDDGAVAGVAIAATLAGADAALLEYMAVDASWRGKGVGERLFRAAAESAEEDGRLLLVEVDSDREESLDRERRTRVKRFYLRLRCRRVEGLTYRMPRVAEAEPPAMDLLVYGSALPECIERGRLRGWIEAVYGQVYGVGTSDSRIEAMLCGCPECLTLVE